MPKSNVEKEARPVICDNCAWSGSEDEIKVSLADVPGLLQRIDPGGEVPIGECPECGALAYLDKDSVKKYPLQTLLGALTYIANKSKTLAGWKLDPKGHDVNIAELLDLETRARAAIDQIGNTDTKLVIEVQRGSVSAVYSDCKTVEVFAVDLDGAQVGEGVYCVKHEIEPLTEAPDLVSDALTDGMGKAPR